MGKLLMGNQIYIQNIRLTYVDFQCSAQLVVDLLGTVEKHLQVRITNVANVKKLGAVHIELKVV